MAFERSTLDHASGVDLNGLQDLTREAQASADGGRTLEKKLYKSVWQTSEYPPPLWLFPYALLLRRCAAYLAPSARPAWR